MHFPHLQPLEPRTLLATNLADGVLTITPSLRNNIIDVRGSGTSTVIEVRDNGDLRLFQGVRRITIRGGSRGDQIDCTDTPVPITIFGGRGSDVIFGGDSNDRIFAGPGDDRLSGGLGGDVLSGEAGADVVTYEDRIAPLALSIGDGRPNDGELSGPGLAGEGDDVRGDVEVVIGGAGDDTIRGGSGPNTLFGGTGDDLLFGGDGDDLLIGQRGADRLQGGPGNDVLLASDQIGRDSLSGGAGFDFAAGEPADDIAGVEFVENAL